MLELDDNVHVYGTKRYGDVAGRGWVGGGVASSHDACCSGVY